jgi:hypothetical protein
VYIKVIPKKNKTAEIIRILPGRHPAGSRQAKMLLNKCLSNHLAEPGGPGVYRFGRRLLFDSLEEKFLRAWKADVNNAVVQASNDHTPVPGIKP